MTKQNKQTINHMFKKKKKRKKTQVNFVEPGFWPWEIL